MNNGQLWTNRFSSWLKEVSRYLRYILSGHLVIVLFFLFGWASYQYQDWLKNVPPSFPASWIAGIVLGLLMIYSPVKFFLKPADNIYLLPIESRLKGYFFRSHLLAFFVQGFLLFIVSGLLMPMLLAVHGKTISLFWLWIFLLLGKGLILIVKYDSLVKATVLPWERLIEAEISSMQRFYQLANLFTDVPHLRNQVRARKWANLLMPKLNFAPESSHRYLLFRTFFRANDYFGLVLRLTTIPAIVLIFGDLGIGQAVIALAFFYLTQLQLLPIARHYDGHLWVTLYPLPKELRENAVLALLRVVWLGQMLIFVLLSIPFADITTSFALALGSLVIGESFQIYAKKKLMNR